MCKPGNKTKQQTQPTSSLLQAKQSAILIDGKIVDVTKFMRRHPGGSIIRFMNGTDGTNAFNAFHSRSARAQKLLTSLPQRIANAEDLKEFEVKDSKEVLQDFKKLDDELRKEGWYDPDPFHVLYRLLELFIMHVIGLTLLLQYWDSNIFFTAFGIVILGIASGRCGWLMHEGGHTSLTGRIWLDFHLQRFLYGFGCGMSGRWWRIQHNKHHATPQKLKHDPDLNTMPLVAFCETVGAQAQTYFQKKWIGVQNLFFIPLTTFLVAFGWTTFLHPRCIYIKKEWMEAFWIFCRYAVWTYLGQQYWGWKLSVLFYCAYLWVAAAYIFTNFAVSHTHLPTIAKSEHVNWVSYSAFYTMNCSHTWWCNWWMAYLNFQIEHHLFPSMPQYRFPEVSKRVKVLFKKHGYPYQYTDYFTALHKTFQNLESVAHAVG